MEYGREGFGRGGGGEKRRYQKIFYNIRAKEKKKGYLFLVGINSNLKPVYRDGCPTLFVLSRKQRFFGGCSFVEMQYICHSSPRAGVFRWFRLLFAHNKFARDAYAEMETR
jgi:hypothetical protein